MAEAAFGLAMGFFSIMVLALISMGSAMQVQSASKTCFDGGIQLGAPADSGNEGGSARAMATDDLIVHWQGNFFDAELRAVDPAELTAREGWALAVLS